MSDLSPTSTSASNLLRDKFLALKDAQELADLLEIKYERLHYLIYHPLQFRYSSLEIPKRSGGERQLLIPNKELRALQRKLAKILTAVYGTSNNTSAHGFMPARNIVTNARLHAGRKYVLNLDLQDFFSSINFGRVRGLFLKRPYELPADVATITAQICCFDNKLPQGAPTSPMISNMICARLDSRLQKLANQYRCIYTRYADDITFSTYLSKFPSSLAVLSDENKVILGSALVTSITENGFVINDSKVRFQTRPWRQVVTGLIVNKQPNVDRKHTGQIRAMLHSWEKFGYASAQVEFLKRYDLKHRKTTNNPKLFAQIVRGKIEFLGMVRGKTNKLYLDFLKQMEKLQVDGKPTETPQLGQTSVTLEVVADTKPTASVADTALENVDRKEMHTIKQPQNSKPQIDVAIMTILAEEYDAVLECLPTLEPVRGSDKKPNIYDYRTGFVLSGKYATPYKILLGRLGRAGNSQGALGIKHIIDSWSPRYILLVGIAGGFDKDHVQLGDVIISDVICNYEYGKLDDGKYTLKPYQSYQTDIGLLNVALGLSSRVNNWAQLLLEKNPNIKAVKGIVASGEKVVDDPSVPFFQQALHILGGIHAIEMEGVGASMAIQHAHSVGDKPIFMMIRGISDMPRHPQALDSVEGTATKTEERSTAERDRWKNLASLAAASFAVAMIQSGLPRPPKATKV